MKFSNYQKGLIYQLLENAYSYDSNFKKDFDSNWRDCDDFFYTNLNIADECGFVTTVDDTPIGFICWDPRNIPEYVELGHNCIIPQYKGLKLGKLQLQEAVRRITTKRVKVIRVTTNEMLLPAQKNYESVGFKLKRKRDADIGKEYLGLLMDYELEVKGNSIDNLFN